MQKLKAFTILELLVAMVISSLVISASYLTYDIVYKQFLTFKKVDSNVLQALTFSNILNNDIATGEFVYKSNNGINVIGFDGNETTYYFGSDHIIRNVAGVIDTFSIPATNVKYGEMEGGLMGNGLLDKFEITITINETQNTLSFHKHYAANLRMLAEGEGMK